LGSARTYGLQLQGRAGDLLGPTQGHLADLRLSRDGSQREALEHAEPRGRGLSRQPLLQHRFGGGAEPTARLCGNCQLIQHVVLASGESIEAGMAERAGAFRILPAEDAHQGRTVTATACSVLYYQELIPRPIESSAQGPRQDTREEWQISPFRLYLVITTG